tara:strand:- start:243 stop:473 length:231 start_codon:yes stop_codon:yes gene_type:complete
MYKNVIYNLDNIMNLSDFKNTIINNTPNKSKYFIDNIKVSYDYQDKTIIPNDLDLMKPYILYNISIVPIKCEKHLK